MITCVALRRVSLALLLFSLLTVFLSSQSNPAHADGELITNWKPLTGLASFLCFDTHQPSRVIGQATNGDVISYNWVTDQSTTLVKGVSQSYSTIDCNSYSGLGYYNLNDAVYRFSLSDGSTQRIDRRPTNFANDGSQQVYAVDTQGNNVWSSADGGLNWQTLPLPAESGRVQSLTVSSISGHAIYLSYKMPSQVPINLFNIYFSSDAGQTWQRRTSNPISGTDYNLNLATMNGHFSTVDTLQLVYQGNPHVGEGYAISIDGGRSNHSGGNRTGPYSRPQLYQTTTGILRLDEADPAKFLSFTSDGGANWSTVATPFKAHDIFEKVCPGPGSLVQATYSPDEFFYNSCDDSQNSSLWHSLDGGRNWQKLGSNLPEVVATTPYAPTSLLGYKNKTLYVLDDFAVDKSLTKTAPRQNLPDNTYFEATGHNLNGIFKSYWEAHGGLAQFGYPQTEVFREYNTSDGKIYSVQYFERNRFEWHPEYAGTPYEVELGLLGSNQTSDQRAKGETPFNRVNNPNQAGTTYFEATGHTLSSSFQTYWQAHGGLALYGYPLSEPFMEVNPDDGKTYLVQYFERNRFELHPENAGTPYEVELGLLGNTLLKQKGWL